MKMSIFTKKLHTCTQKKRQNLQGAKYKRILTYHREK